jgi:hypothetical protein
MPIGRSRFPTRMRARAVGSVYSWGRLSIVLTSLIIGLLFQRFGTAGVSVFISVAMLVVIVPVGIFGPRTRGLTLEQISDSRRRLLLADIDPSLRRQLCHHQGSGCAHQFIDAKPDPRCHSALKRLG